MPRAEAQATVKALCARALAEGRPLSDLAREAHPDLHEAAFDPLAQMGQAPADALRFVERAKSM
jgi:3-carboxy-cis,cis-muconate cycloisomerase